jgi:hypothetical protein
VDYCILVYAHCQKLMKSVESHGSSSLLFMMKVMVSHVVSDAHEVMTGIALIMFLLCCFVSSATHRYVNMCHGTTLIRGEILCSSSSLKTMLYTII